MIWSSNAANAFFGMPPVNIRPWMCWLLSAGLTTGCVGEKGAAPALRPPGQTFGTVTVSPRNAIIAVGGTLLPVTVTGETLEGMQIAEFDSVRSVLNSIVDTLRVALAENGAITGRASSGGTPVRVNTFAWVHGAGKGDQTIVQITPTLIPGVTLSMQPAPTDSARLDWGSGKNVSLVLLNPATGQSTPTSPFRFSVRPADAEKIYVYTPALVLPGSGNLVVGFTAGSQTVNQVRATAPMGTAWVHAEVNAYGIVLRDSVQYTLSYPTSVQINIAQDGLTVRIGDRNGRHYNMKAGGQLFFAGNLEDRAAGKKIPVSVIFDRPEAALAGVPPRTDGGISGNVIDLTGFSGRRFVTPGVYQWTMTVGGNTPPWTGQIVTGTVTVW